MGKVAGDRGWKLELRFKPGTLSRRNLEGRSCCCANARTTTVAGVCGRAGPARETPLRAFPSPPNRCRAGSLSNLALKLRRNKRGRNHTDQTRQCPLQQISPDSRQCRIRPKIQRPGSCSNRIEYREKHGNGRGAESTTVCRAGGCRLLPGHLSATGDCGQDGGQCHRQPKIDADEGCHTSDAVGMIRLRQKAKRVIDLGCKRAWPAGASRSPRSNARHEPGALLTG